MQQAGCQKKTERGNHKGPLCIEKLKACGDVAWLRTLGLILDGFDRSILCKCLFEFILISVILVVAYVDLQNPIVEKIELED